MKYLYLALMIVSAAPVLAADPVEPDPSLTPGAVHQPPTDLAILCRHGYTKTVRDVPQSMKHQVFERYGYNPKQVPAGNFEIDHLVPLALDGQNSITNLWPQSYLSQPLNAHKKDILEDKLYHMVCRHELDLATAQHEIATDWVGAYRKYVVRKAPQ